MTAGRSPASTARATGRWIAGALGLLIGLGSSVLLIAWLTLHWAILPHIQHWRGAIERRASHALGVPVTLGEIRVRSSGWVPSIELRDVDFHDPLGRPALRLPRVVAAFSPRSLLSFEPDFEQLLIESPELDIRRGADGRITVAGLSLDGPGGSADDTTASDWFFRQHEFVIRGGTLRWTDATRDAPTLVLANVDLVVRNGLRRHAMRLDATPPTAWGDRFQFSARFTQPLLARAGDWRRWNGSVHADLPRADVRELRRYATLPFELGEGRGSLRGWLDVQTGEARAATLDLALRDVRLRLAPSAEPLAFAEIEGRLSGTRAASGLTLAAERFGFVTGDGLRWPRGAFAFAWQQRAGEPSTGGSFSADQLDLGLLARLAAGLPLGTAVHRLLDDFRPQAVARPLTARWDGPVDAPTHYRVVGKLSGVSLAALASGVVDEPGRPGVRNADVQLDASDTGGSARVDIANGALELPGVFEAPLVPLTRLAASVLWTVAPAGAASAPSAIAVQVQNASFANADARAELTARWSTGPAPGSGRGVRFPGRLELDGKVSDAVATRIHRYLPLGLSRDVRDYVQRAVRGGRVGTASVRVRGDLADFPFFDAPRLVADKVRRSDGEFRIAARVEDLSYAYIPDPTGAAPAARPVWPLLTRGAADLVLDRNTVEIGNARARIGELDWDRLTGRIDHLESDAVLSLDATARGTLADLLRAVEASPVGGWLGGALAGASATGGADLKLALGVPLAHADTGSTVRGSLALGGNDLRMTADTPLLANARGRVDFTQDGFNLAGATARVLGGDASLQGGTQADGVIRLAAQGSASADGLRQAGELGPVARLARRLAGQARYRATLDFVRGVPELSVTSNLVGLALDLPPPFAKPAETALAMRYRTAAEPAPDGAPPREVLQVDLGSLLQARYLRERRTDGTVRVVRGAIGVAAEASLPEKGVAANVTARTLDVDAWERVADEVFPTTGAPRSAAAAAAGSAAAGSTAPGSAGDGHEPDRVALHVQELIAGGRRLTGVTAGLSRDGETWRADVEADQLAGHVDYRPPGRGDASPGSGRVYARLSRLVLPKIDAEQVSSLLDAPPASVPALDIVIDDLDLRGTRLGRVEIVATNRLGGPRRAGQRDWQLTRLAIKTPEAELTGTGRWAASPVGAPGGAPPPRRMSIDFVLQVDDGGALLDRLGTKGAVRGGAGQLKGRIGWLGSPLAIDFASLGGEVNVAIDAGQFLKADPGAARLLGVLNLQSLPRRLSLDFRDVFAEGFAFDNVGGDVRIAEGVAQTRNLRMRGVQATVLMEGSADIERETQDLRVVVVPEINAGTAALAYAAINPAIGLGAFLAQWILRKPLMAASTREFHISGRWDDPKIEPVAKGAALAAESPAASGPARNP